MLQPKKKTHDLIASINDMLMGGPDHDRLSKIRHEAEKMEKFGFYVDAKRVLGMISAMLGDVSGVRQQFHAAVSASGRDPLVLLNYATALGNLHHHTYAVELAKEAVESTPDDLALLEDALKIFSDAYDVDNTRQLMSHMKKLGWEVEKFDPTIDSRAEIVGDLLNLAGASWADLSNRIALVSDTLRDNGYSLRMSSEELCEEVILYEFNIESDINGALVAEAIVQKTIAGQPFSPADKVMTFSCMPA